MQDLFDIVLNFLDLLLEIIGLVFFLITLHCLYLAHLSLEKGDHVC